MGSIPPDKGHPFLRERFHQFRRKDPPRRHFRPNQQAEVVGPVEIARVFSFLMFPCAIEAEGEGELHISAQCFVTRCGIPPVREITLIKNTPKIEPLPVKAQSRPIPGNFSKPEVALNLVNGSLEGILEGCGKVVERWVVGMPERRVREGEGKAGFGAVIDLDSGLGDHRPLSVNREG